ncbi:hypothetical protein bcere0028_5480 [Bacillus cereus AH1271]|nr:hypothetical protein bcere0028_5480 [Bacillus cereus AH1271]
MASGGSSILPVPVFYWIIEKMKFYKERRGCFEGCKFYLYERKDC